MAKLFNLTQFHVTSRYPLKNTLLLTYNFLIWISPQTKKIRRKKISKEHEQSRNVNFESPIASINPKTK